MWRTWFWCSSSLLQSQRLISKPLNEIGVLKRLENELLFLIYMIRQIKSIYEYWNDNRQENVEHMNLKGIGQVDINWKAKRGTYKAWLTTKSILQSLLFQPFHDY